MVASNSNTDQDDENENSGASTTFTPELLKTRSMQLSQELIDQALKKIGKTVSFPISSKEVESLLTIICTKRHLTKTASGALDSTEGWNRWIQTDSAAALTLLDRDGDGMISRSEFELFVCEHPMLLGPLSRMESSFHAYDVDADGYLSVNEVCTLMLDMEKEQAVTRNSAVDRSANATAIMMNARIRVYFKKYCKKRKKGLTFFEFSKMALENPEILGTAAGLRPFFQEQDIDNDGFLTGKEVYKMLEKFCFLRGFSAA
jgi:Ca2+-binding EF-hand superfamily protein